MSLRWIAFVIVAAPAILSAAVDFQRDVRPILSNNCFACHGPDHQTRLAGLRLDLRDAAVEVRKTGAAIVPGDPSKSLIWQRITSAKPAQRMPPAYSHKTLTQPQIATLKLWIEEGAPWKEHWSFVPPVKRTPPTVKNADWVRNPIDAFVLSRVEAANLVPAAEADRRKLIRRLALDLTGLPPAPADVERFLNRPYDEIVDFYLASPHYGEHRARYWLDAARYADTHGIHVDNYREMWPYRDWVINAFNRNVPFDRFTIEQLAGDLLPNPTLDQQIATGFHRCNVTTNEAGIIADEFEAIYAKDRVDTTSAVWLGLTVGCATCHDHKFDPISQRDHYALAAFFRNTKQPVMDGNVSDTKPVVIVPKAEDLSRWQSIQIEHAQLKLQLSGLTTDNPPLSAPPARPLADNSEIFTHLDEVAFAGKQTTDLPNQKVFDAAKPFSIALWMRPPKTDDSQVVLSQYDPAEPKGRLQRSQTKQELSGAGRRKRVGLGPVPEKRKGREGASPNDRETRSPIAPKRVGLARVPEKQGRGWYVEIGSRVPLFRLVGDEGKTLDARAGHLDQVKPGEWNHLVVTYDGTGERMGLAMYLNGKPVELQAVEPLAKINGNFKTGAPLRLGGETKRYFAGGAVKDLRIYSRALSEEDARLVALWPRMQAGDVDALRLYQLRHESPDYKGIASQLAAIDLERRAIRRRAAVTHVMSERADQTAFAHILFRGMYDQPRDKVEADVPSALPPMPAAYPRNRLGLAKWLVDPNNPLTARVTVNRFWQEIFGTGLVKTSEDFGAQGEGPSHPELLDWLAVEFRDSGWDAKKLMRLIVTSATYRQAAATTEEKLKADPDNRLLSRGPRFRMDGELIRDYALASSGLLTRTIGGPSVKPYQPEGVWETVAMLGSNTRFYKKDAGDKLYRRSMYTFWKRSAPPASMDIFNAPTREACTVRRERTNTPLQALVTMNDVQFVEAARVLAEHTLSVKGIDAQLDSATAALLARPLEPREREIAKRSYKDFLSYYDAHPADARKLIATGDSKAGSKAPAAELAAMTMLMNELMNLDEVLNK